jgi:hypothetical protein
MRPLPQRPAVPGARGFAPGRRGPVVGAAKVPSLRQLPWLRRCERPLARHARRRRRCDMPLAPPPTAVSSFRESPGAGPPRWPTARVAERSGSRPRHPLRRWLARFSPNPSSRNCSCSSPAGTAALFPHPRRSRRCASPARGGVVVARGHWHLRPQRCRRSEDRLAQVPHVAPARRSPSALAQAHGIRYEGGWPLSPQTHLPVITRVPVLPTSSSSPGPGLVRMGLR